MCFLFALIISVFIICGALFTMTRDFVDNLYENMTRSRHVFVAAIGAFLAIICGLRLSDGTIFLGFYFCLILGEKGLVFRRVFENTVMGV